MQKSTEIFVGRKEEIDRFMKFLERKENATFVIIGEPGIGKTSFLNEMRNTLAKNPTYVIGFHEVTFSTDIVSPFVGVFRKLIENLAQIEGDQIESQLKRIATAAKMFAAKKGDRFARAIIKDIISKLIGEHFTKELEELRDEFAKTPTIYSLSSDFVAKHTNEFIYDYVELLETVSPEFTQKKFVLLIDQFERAPMPAYNIFLDLASKKMQNILLTVALKIEEKGAQRFRFIQAELERIGVEKAEFRPLSTSEIGEWMLRLGKSFSHSELQRIKELSAGFPFTISEWIKTSEACDLQDLEIVRGKYCEFISWRIRDLDRECALMVRRLSVLEHPMAIEDYEKLAGVSSGLCGILLEKLMEKWIFTLQGDRVWFKHELIRFCIEQSLTETERKVYNESAARVFQQKLDSSLEAKTQVDLEIGLGCAYHWHFAGRHKESLDRNTSIADFCLDVGMIDLAEKSVLYALTDAEAIGDEKSKMLMKIRLIPIYSEWGRIDEARLIASEALAYFRKEKDENNEACVLHDLAIVEQTQGNFDVALQLFNTSLMVWQKLDYQDGIRKALYQIATIEKDRGNYKKALEITMKCLEIEDKIGNESGKSKGLFQLALIEYRLGNFDKAIELLNESNAIGEKLGDFSLISKNLHQIAVIENEIGNLDKALELFYNSIAIKQKLNDQIGLAASSYQIAIIERKRGNYEKALKLLTKSLEVSERFGNKGGVVRSLHAIATVEVSLGNYEKALELLKKSLEIAKRLGERPTVASALFMVGVANEKLNNLAIAAVNYSEALSIFQEIGDYHQARAKKAYERVMKNLMKK